MLLVQNVVPRHLDDFILVSEEEIQQSVALCIEKAHTLAEGAGAASLAGLIKLEDRFRGLTVALVMTGGNITIAQLRAALSLAKV